MNMIQTLMEDVVERIKSFDSEGLPESTYIQTKQHIVNLLGLKAGDIFARYIDATDGFFYFKDTEGMEACIKEILEIHDKQMKTLSPP